MPEISRFLGVVIYIYHNEHNPPHFHAQYGEYAISIEIETGIIDGYFTKRALRAVMEWHEMHKEELMEDWKLAATSQPLRKINPLE